MVVLTFDDRTWPGMPSYCQTNSHLASSVMLNRCESLAWSEVGR